MVQVKKTMQQKTVSFSFKLVRIATLHHFILIVNIFVQLTVIHS